MISVRRSFYVLTIQNIEKNSSEYSQDIGSHFCFTLACTILVPVPTDPERTRCGIARVYSELSFCYGIMRSSSVLLVH